MPKAKTESKKVVQFLRVNLTQQEILDAGKSMADTSTELAKLEGEKARINSDFAAKIKACEAKVTVLSNKITTGYEYRNVNCRVILGQPETNQKQVWRLDTDELVETTFMTQDEMQRELLSAEKKEDEAA